MRGQGFLLTLTTSVVGLVGGFVSFTATAAATTAEMIAGLTLAAESLGQATEVTIAMTGFWPWEVMQSATANVRKIRTAVEEEIKRLDKMLDYLHKRVIRKPESSYEVNPPPPMVVTDDSFTPDDFESVNSSGDQPIDTSALVPEEEPVIPDNRIPV
ncbi:hypothetical protein [Actinophytocola sediminis]